ncbi:MAG: NUDIX hydrolase [Bacteroidota bacterium]
MNHKHLELTKQILAIAQSGLHYTESDYDIDRYEQLRQIGLEMMQHLSGAEIPVIEALFSNTAHYATPMVDVRAIIFKDDEILLIKEKTDSRWAPPGGWADVGYTPSEVAVKEVKEEAGLDVKAKRLLGVLDKRCYPHPPEPYYVYKIFIECEITGGVAKEGMETLDVGFFKIDSLPELSENRVLESQLVDIYNRRNNGSFEAVVD